MFLVRRHRTPGLGGAVALVVWLVLGVAALAPGQAEALNVGTNLGNHTPNANFDCRWRPSVIGPQFFGTPDNCTYVGTTPGQTADAPFGGGVVTSVKVKAAAPVGPMQVTAVRAISGTTTGFTCCFYGGESQIFRPRANATTTVRVRVPVASFIDPDAGIQVVDYLGLTVRANGVAIPGQFPGNGDFEGSLAFFPRITPGDSTNGRVDGYGNGLVPLLSADITPLCGGGINSAPARRVASAWPRDAALPPPAGPARKGRCLGGVSPRDGQLGGSTAQVPLDCNLAITCRGKLTLKAGRTKLGAGKFKIPSGARKRVKVKLTGDGKRAVKGRRSIGAKAKAKVTAGPDESTKIKLKR